MSAHRAVLLALLVVGGSLAVAAPAGATPRASADSTDTVGPTVIGPTAAQSAAENESANASLGADISSFMQSSAAEISGAVDTGMWTASFNSTENQSERERLVERRTSDLRAELDDVRDRKQALEAEREAGNLSEAAYKAQVGQLVGRINALESAINATESRARQANANVDAVEALETDARNLTGPRIAAVARNSSGVETPGPPDGVGDAGPPEGAGDSGPPEDARNGTPPSDDAGPPANASDGDAGAPGTADGDDGTGLPGERGPPDEAPVGDDPSNRTVEPGPVPNATPSD